MEKLILMLKSEAQNQRIIRELRIKIKKREEILDFLDQELK